MPEPAEAQSTDTVMMIRPVRFQANPQTAASNHFQAERPLDSLEESQRIATGEFEGLVGALEEAGVVTLVYEDTREPHSPDSLFPNNWVSFHADGTVVLYPMEAPNRRVERREDLIETIGAREGFAVRRIVDLSHHEANGHYLESTGSLVLDRVHRVAYACLSSRTHLDPLGDFAQRLDYDVVTFDGLDAAGRPIYHTNVMMAIGEGFAVVCAGAIADERQRADVLGRLAADGHEVIEIDHAQVASYAGNMLALRSRAGEPLVAMSSGALESLDGGQRRRIERHGRIVSAPIGHIERQAGGSVRCMLAEVHLPRREAVAATLR